MKYLNSYICVLKYKYNILFPKIKRLYLSNFYIFYLLYFSDYREFYNINHMIKIFLCNIQNNQVRDEQTELKNKIIKKKKIDYKYMSDFKIKT